MLRTPFRSVRETQKEKARAETMEGPMAGMATSAKALRGVAPRQRAASKSEGGSLLRPVSTEE
jgi:hypothetical protein